MKALPPYLKIIRPGNALMATVTVALGYWLSKSALPVSSLAQMMVAAFCAVGYGNVINDILDVGSDRISHPDRPLPRSELTLSTAIIFAFFLCGFSFTNAFLVSTAHGIGASLPLVILTLYAFFFKGTPLAGNIVVSLLVGYTIIFGGLSAPRCGRLLIPAVLAFFLNLCREIIKDVQDEPGDRAAGVRTTAIVPEKILKTILFMSSAVYALLLFTPFLLKQFGIVYCIINVVIVLPLHFHWAILVLNRQWKEYLQRISSIIKIEMVAGLLALAADQAYF